MKISDIIERISEKFNLNGNTKQHLIDAVQDKLKLDTTVVINDDENKIIEEQIKNIENETSTLNDYLNNSGASVNIITDLKNTLAQLQISVLIKKIKKADNNIDVINSLLSTITDNMNSNNMMLLNSMSGGSNDKYNKVQSNVKVLLGTNKVAGDIIAIIDRLDRMDGEIKQLLDQLFSNKPQLLIDEFLLQIILLRYNCLIYYFNNNISELNRTNFLERYKQLEAHLKAILLRIQTKSKQPTILRTLDPKLKVFYENINKVHSVLSELFPHMTDEDKMKVEGVFTKLIEELGIINKLFSKKKESEQKIKQKAKEISPETSPILMKHSVDSGKPSFPKECIQTNRNINFDNEYIKCLFNKDELTSSDYEQLKHILPKKIQSIFEEYIRDKKDIDIDELLEKFSVKNVGVSTNTEIANILDSIKRTHKEKLKNKVLLVPTTDNPLLSAKGIKVAEKVEGVKNVNPILMPKSYHKQQPVLLPKSNQPEASPSQSNTEALNIASKSKYLKMKNKYLQLKELLGL